MGLCRYCQEKAGWFSDEHEACKARFTSGRELIYSAVVDAFLEGRPCSEIADSLTEIASVSRIGDAAFRESVRKGINDGGEKLALTKGCNETSVNQLLEFLNEIDVVDPVERVAMKGYQAVTFSSMLWHAMNGRASELDIPHSFNISPGEMVISCFMSNYLQEITQRTRQGGYAGISVPLGHGMRANLGGFQSQPVERHAMKALDYGELLFTTKALYFAGEHKSFRIGYDKVVSFRPYTDALGLFRSAANAKLEVFVSPQFTPYVGPFMHNLVTFLCSAEGREMYSGAKQYRL